MSGRLFPAHLTLPNGKSVVVDIAREEQVNEIRLFFKQHFRPRSPAIVHLVNCDPARSVQQENEEEEDARRTKWTRQVLRQSFTLTVRDPADPDQLVAVALSRLESLTEKKMDFPRSQQQSLNGSFFAALKQGVDVFSQAGTDAVFHLGVLCVREDFCRLGLAKKLIQLTIELASTTNAGAIDVEATNEYSVKPLAQLGFVPLKSIEYAKFEYQGIRPLENVPELIDHPAAHHMALYLPKKIPEKLL